MYNLVTLFTIYAKKKQQQQQASFTENFVDQQTAGLGGVNFILTELGNPDLNFKTLHAYGPKYFINTMAEIVEIMGSYCGDNQFHEANYLICSPDFTIKKEAKETVILTLHKKRQRHPSWDDSLYRMKICPNPMCDNDAEHTY